jgi:hypothetical protein
MNELEVAENWIRDVMVADGTFQGIVSGRWWKYVAKPGAIDAGIYGLYGLQSPEDFQGLGTVRLLTRPVYWARVIKRGFPDTDMKIAANRLDEVLGKTVRAIVQDHNGATNYMISSRRIQPISFVEDSGDPTKPIFHVGGFYRLEMSEV